MKENKTIYFSHDTNASNDPKLVNIRISFGWAGIGMYWAIIEALHKERDGKLPEGLISSMIYDYFCHEEIRTSTKMRDDAKPFEETLYLTDLLVKSDGTTTSKRVQENLEEINSKIEKGREGAFKRWGKDSNNSKVNANPMATQWEPNAIKEKKRKESKDILCLANAKEQKTELNPKGISVKELYSTLGLPEKTRNISKWQDEASTAIKYFTDIGDKSSSVFKCFKENNQKARTAFSDCKELSKDSVMYFLKVYNQLIKI